MNNSEVYNNTPPTFTGGNIGMATIKQNKKFPLIIGGAILLLAIIIIVTIFLIKPKEVDLIVLVAPENANIEIDGKSYKNGTHKIATGTHTAVVSAEGFSTSEFYFDVENDQPYLFTEHLDEETSKYSEKDYEILSLIADDAISINAVNNQKRAKTLLSVLPISFDEYDVKITNATGNEECNDSSLCIQITNSGSLNEDGAKSLLRKYNYDPNDYEIIYTKEEANNEQ